MPAETSLRPIDNYFLQKPEPVKSCLQALRELLLNYNSDIAETWKYGMPFYCYKGKMFCYLWTDKKTGQPYIGIVEGKRVEHPLLIQDTRKRMKVFYIDPVADLPVNDITMLLNMALVFYK